MGHQPFQLHLQQHRPFPAGVADGFPGGFVGSQQVEAVHDDTGETVALGPVGYVADSHLQTLGHGYGVAVIFADKDHRQVVDAGEVHRLVGFALAGGAIAEIDQGNPAVALHLATQSVADGLGQPGGHHIGKLDDVVGKVGALEGELASVAVGVALLAHKGQHYLGGSEAHGHFDGQVAIVGEQEAVAVLFGGQQAAQLGGFVALAGGGDRHLALAVHHPDALVNGADGNHPAVVVNQVFRRDALGQGPEGVGRDTVGLAVGLIG